MMRGFGKKAILLLGAWALTGASGECIDTLDFIYKAENNLTDDSAVREYILCPETTFEVATKFESDGSPRYGQYPLLLARSNLHIRCGESGDSSNNCILQDGEQQVWFHDKFNPGKAITNVRLEGLTFTNEGTYTVMVDSFGELTLHDCIFKENVNQSPVVIEPPFASDSYIRQLDENSVSKQIADARRVAEENRQSTKVVLSECIFEDNEVWSYSGATIEGLVVNKGGTLEITDSMFVGTKTHPKEKTKLEFMIHNVGGNLTLKNTCFISNEEVIAPVVNEDGVLHLLSNSVQRRTQAVPATGCPFVSHGELDKQTFEASLFSCEAVDTPVCTSKALPKVDIPCVQKLDTIYEIEQDLTTSHHTRTYQLCPGLEYNIRSLSEGGDAHSEHSLPLIIGRSNIHVLCGADGKSSNGCKLKGGPMQVGIHDEYRDAQPIANAVIQGITFSGATFVNVLANTPGHVTIRDCVFSENANLASIYVDHVNNGYRRQLGENDSDAKQDEVASLTVVDSTFKDNIIGTVPRQSSGLVTNFGYIRLIRNKFLNTTNTPEEQIRAPPDEAFMSSIITLPDGTNTFIGYIVGNLGGKLEMFGNCFIDNGVTIAPVIDLLGSLNLSFNSGESTGGKAAHWCEFLALVQGQDHNVTQGLSSEMPFSCFDFDVETCEEADALARSDTLDGIDPKEGTPNGSPQDASTTTMLQDKPGLRTAVFCLVALVATISVAALFVATSRVFCHRTQIEDVEDIQLDADVDEDYEDYDDDVYEDYDDDDSLEVEDLKDDEDVVL